MIWWALIFQYDKLSRTSMGCIWYFTAYIGINIFFCFRSGGMMNYLEWFNDMMCTHLWIEWSNSHLLTMNMIFWHISIWTNSLAFHLEVCWIILNGLTLWCITHLWLELSNSHIQGSYMIFCPIQRYENILLVSIWKYDELSWMVFVVVCRVDNCCGIYHLWY